MTTIAPPPADLDRVEYVSFVMRQLALLLDPQYGRISVLADEFELHESTVGQWMRNGRVPHKAAKRLERRFGKKLVKIEQLIG